MSAPVDVGRPGKTGSGIRTISSYTTVGVCCAILNNTIVLSADSAGISFLPATLLALTLVTPLAYALHSIFTFRGRMSVKAFIRFFSGTLLGSILSVCLMVIFCSWLSIRVSIAMPLTTLVLVVWNFLNARRAILSREVPISAGEFERAR